jgi:hypothetical protein
MMASRFAFKHHLIDLDLPPGTYAQAALADLDGDGLLEYVLGQRFGTIYSYKFQAPDHWLRTEIGHDSPSDVGASVLDVDSDGKPDFVAGGCWYRNPGSVTEPWERFVFDPELSYVHDVACGDLDGDGKGEVITMSDRNDLRWYKIPADPTELWTAHFVAPPVHAGVSLGDIDGDGQLDIVRTDRWFRNLDGNGQRWEVHYIGPNSMPPPDFQPPFAFDGTISQVCDVNADGKTDIVFVDAEIPGGSIWWTENVRGDGTRWVHHDIYNPEAAGGTRRGAFHSLIVADMDGDGDLDVVTAEMEGVAGDGPPRTYIYENVDSCGTAWREHVILDVGLGGHALVAGDVTGNGKIDIVSKPWNPSPKNSVGGRMFVVFLENISA